MSATEELRRLLDERGVEYERTEDDTTIYYDSDGNRYTYNVNPDSGWSQLFGYNLTPEQAIAATLGGGKLTVDDVRDLIERHSDASGGNGRDFHNGAYVAIADELNAALGGGECEMEPVWASNALQCSECCSYVSTWDSECEIGAINYCPNCGRKVKR